MSSQRDDQVVVITGANEGIGYHILAALPRDTYRVAGLDIQTTNIDALRDAAPGRVASYRCDVGNTEDVTAAIDGVIDEWDRIDILVNNAAIATVALFDDQTLADTRREFDVNYYGYRRTIRAVLPHMRARDDGIIHNVGSATGLVGHPGLTGYASTKGAIEAFTRSLRLELQDEPISFTVMQPPITNTQMSAALGYPDWLMNDPAEVGRKFADKIESTGPVVTPDWQTKLGISLIQWFPSLWRKGLNRFVHPEYDA